MIFPETIPEHLLMWDVAPERGDTDRIERAAKARSADTLRCHVAQVAAFLPAKGKFVPDEEEEIPRPKGALQDPSISLANPKKVSEGLTLQSAPRP